MELLPTRSPWGTHRKTACSYLMSASLKRICAAFRCAGLAVAGALIVAACAAPGVSAPDYLPLLIDMTVESDRAAPTSPRIVVDGIPAARMDPQGDRVTLEVRIGRRVVELSNLPDACSVEGGRRRVVEVEPGRAAFVVSFHVSCP